MRPSSASPAADSEPAPHWVLVSGLDGSGDRPALARARDLAFQPERRVHLLCLGRPEAGRRRRYRREWAAARVQLHFLDELPSLSAKRFLHAPAFLTVALRLHAWLRIQGPLHLHFRDRGAAAFVALQAKALGLDYDDCTFHCMVDGGLRRERELAGRFMGEGVGSILLEHCERWCAEHSTSVEGASPEALAWAAGQAWALPPVPPLPRPVRTVEPGDLTVCIPHYNYGDHLDGLFASLENQTAQGFEVLVVDDGSTDAGSLEAFDRWAARKAGAAWRFIKKANAGLGRTRNYMAGLARTPYVLFMDADNLAEPAMVERFIQALRSFDADVLTCHLRTFDDRSPAGAPRILHYYAPVGDCLAAGYYINTFGDANMLVRREALLALGGFFEERGVTWEDWEFLARATMAGLRLAVVPEPLLLYRVNPRGFSARSSGYANVRKVQAVFEAGLPDWAVEALKAAYGREQRSYRRRGIDRLRAWGARPLASGWREGMLALGWAVSNQALHSLQGFLGLCPGDDDAQLG